MDRDLRILILEDSPADAELTQRELRKAGIQFLPKVVDTRSAFEKELNGFNPDIILSDFSLPQFTATDALRIRAEQKPDVPFILITGSLGEEVAVECIKDGADDYILKASLKRLPSAMLNALKNRDAEKARAQAERALLDMHRELIYRLTFVAEYRDMETGEHTKRIGSYSALLAGQLAMPPDFVETISFTSIMHDIGKVGIPDSILLKPDKLTPEEFEIMKSHTKIGNKMLADSIYPAMNMAASIALSHHEKWDGSGYPYGLKGKDIPIEGRIVIIADQYDALRSRRPYKQPLTHEQVVKIITEGDGRTMPEHFDPEVLKAFKSTAPAFNTIFEELSPR